MRAPAPVPLILALCLLAASCSPAAVATRDSLPTAGASGPSPTPSPVAEQSPAPAETAALGDITGELIAPGTLIVCTDYPVPRFAQLDSSGEPMGASVDLAAELAERIDLTIEHRDTVFEEIIPDLESGDCDIAIAGHIITPEREERITMIPYLRGQQELTVRIGNPGDLGELTDLCGETVLTRAGSIQEQLVTGTGAYADDGLNDRCLAAGEDPIDLETYPGEAEAVEAFLDGEGVAFLGGSVWVAEYPDQLEELATVVLPGYRTGIGLNRDDRALAEAIRTALDEMIEDGTYLEILTEWGVGQPLE